MSNLPEKDRDGVVLATGDLVLVLFQEKFVDKTTEKVIYKRIRDKADIESTSLDTEKNETGTRELQYYPLTEEGLSLAKYENGEHDTGTGFFRKKDFVISNIKNNDILKINTISLSGAEEEFYTEITSRI